MISQFLTTYEQYNYHVDKQQINMEQLLFQVGLNTHLEPVPSKKKLKKD